MADTEPFSFKINVLPGTWKWLPLDPDDLIDIISPKGSQVADSWAFNAHDPSEYLSVAHCRLHWSRARPVVGDELVSNRRNAMATLIDDQSGGMHDTLLPACDAARYARLGHRGHHRSCAENLAQALAEAQLPPFMPEPLNFFEHTMLDPDGCISILPPPCPPGGYVRLLAQIPFIFVVSACPQDIVPTNGLDLTPKPIALAVRRAGHAANSRAAA